MKKLYTSILLLVCACQHYPDDNIIENYVEDLIEEETGFQIDLSPGSPENEGRWQKKQ